MRPIVRRPALPEPTIADRLVGVFSPAAMRDRLVARWQIGALTGGYKGARRDRRATKAWNAQTQSADAALLPDLPDLRDRSRDLVRNNPLAGGAINTKVTSVVGTGLKVRPQVDREALGLTEAQAEAWEAQARRIFNTWARSAECDLTRTQTFAEIQDTAFRGVLEAGDIFVGFRHLMRPGADLGLKLQMIEADRVGNPDNAVDKARLAGGVEVDDHGAPVAYHVASRHPGDIVHSGTPRTWTRVEAFGPRSGRRQVLHLFRRLRPDQTRGVPDLAPVVELIKQLGDYTESEAQAALIASFFTVFVETEGGEGSPASIAPDALGSNDSAEEMRMGPAAVLDLAQGEKVTIADPGRPNQAFDGFVLSLLRQVGVALELPFELLVKHFTASYSAARAALLEAWKYYRGRRQWLAARLCQPVYEAVIIEAVARGLLAAPGLLASDAARAAWLGSTEWYGDAMPQLDPLKENNADKIAQDEGWKTATEITAEKTGGDWERKNAIRAREVRQRRDAGLDQAAAPPTTDPDPAPDDPEDDGGPDTEQEDES